LKDLVAENVYTLDVNRWLSRFEDDFDVCRELAVSKAGVEPLPSEAKLISLVNKVVCVYPKLLYPQINVYVM